MDTILDALDVTARAQAQARDELARRRLGLNKKDRPVATRPPRYESVVRVKIVRALRAQGYFQDEIAEMIGCNQKTVSKDLAMSPVDLADAREALLTELGLIEEALEAVGQAA